MLCNLTAFDNNVSAADAHDSCKADSFSVLFGVKIHRVFVRKRKVGHTGKNHTGFCRRKRVNNRNVRFVTFSGVGKRTVKIGDVFVCVGIFRFKKAGGFVRPHGMRARRAATDFVKMFK